MSTDSLVGFDGPIRETTLAFRGVEVPLVRPAEPDRLLDDPAVHERNRRDDYMPYWAYLWPGAFLLADALAEGGPLVDQECLELGCGLGLAGLVALRQGAHVRFTDYDEVPLAFVAASARRSGFGTDRCSFGLLDWREPPEAAYPLILGADLLYEHRLVPLVVSVLSRMLSSDGSALIAGPYRVATEGFEPVLDAAGLKHEATKRACLNEEGREVRGTIHRVWKAGARFVGPPVRS